MFQLIVIIAIMLLGLWFVMKPINKKESFLNDIMKIKTYPSLKNDKLFSDIIMYNNDESGRLGIDKCLEYCNGVCVELGQTSNASCFASNPPLGPNYATTFVDWQNELDTADRSASTLIYPSIR